MAVEAGFRFSANNLQEYLHCPRRFELKYILKQPYPAVVSQPALELERKIAEGKQFHLIADQFLSGVPKDIIFERNTTAPVNSWLVAFFAFIEHFSHLNYLSEYSLLFPFEGFQLLARYDFVVQLEDESVLILDWKTGHKQPVYSYYETRIQTILYPFIAVECLPFSSISVPQDPFSILMQYWFPNFPADHIQFPYSAKAHKKNELYLKNLIQEIKNTSIGEFGKTEDIRRCNFCQYRTLCERGELAGNFNLASDNEVDLNDLIEDISLDMLDEIQY